MRGGGGEGRGCTTSPPSRPFVKCLMFFFFSLSLAVGSLVFSGDIEGQTDSGFQALSRFIFQMTVFLALNSLNGSVVCALFALPKIKLISQLILVNFCSYR